MAAATRSKRARSDESTTVVEEGKKAEKIPEWTPSQVIEVETEVMSQMVLFRALGLRAMEEALGRMHKKVVYGSGPTRIVLSQMLYLFCDEYTKAYPTRELAVVSTTPDFYWAISRLKDAATSDKFGEAAAINAAEYSECKLKCPACGTGIVVISGMVTRRCYAVRGDIKLGVFLCSNECIGKYNATLYELAPVSSISSRMTLCDYPDCLKMAAIYDHIHKVNACSLPCLYGIGWAAGQTDGLQFRFIAGKSSIPRVDLPPFYFHDELEDYDRGKPLTLRAPAKKKKGTEEGKYGSK